MKKVILFLFLLGICVFSLFAEVGDTNYVAVEKSYIKSSTWFFAKKVGSVYYGDGVEIIEEKGAWVKVSLAEDSSVTGWISEKSLTSKKIVLRDNNRLSTSTEELALAGKGFSKEVEDSYKKNNTLDFSLVDAMEKQTLSDDEIINFIVEGNLEGVEQ